MERWRATDGEQSDEGIQTHFLLQVSGEMSGWVFSSYLKNSLNWYDTYELSAFETEKIIISQMQFEFVLVSPWSGIIP